MHGRGDRRRQVGEDRVDFRLDEDVHLGNTTQRGRELPGHEVGVPGAPQPRAVLQHADPLRTEEAHL